MKDEADRQDQQRYVAAQHMLHCDVLQTDSDQHSALYKTNSAPVLHQDLYLVLRLSGPALHCKVQLCCCL